MFEDKTAVYNWAKLIKYIQPFLCLKFIVALSPEYRLPLCKINCHVQIVPDHFVNLLCIQIFL